MMTGVSIPAGLDAQRSLGPVWSRWLDRLPALASEIVAEWTLTRDGEPFTGFTGEGTWILALRCSTCSNPAPPFATVLLPR